MCPFEIWFSAVSNCVSRRDIVTTAYGTIVPVSHGTAKGIFSQKIAR
jgi:hypothetical protein